MPDNAIIDLEKSLGAQTTVWQAWRAFQKIKKSKFNFAISLIIPVIILVLAVFSFEAISNGGLVSYKSVNSLSSIFLGYSVGITGFLIAGVSILVSVNDKDLFIVMAKTKYKQNNKTYSQYSQFQFIFFSLIVALSYHLILLSTSVFLNFITSEGAFLTSWFQQFFHPSDSSVYFINCGVISLMAWLFIRCLLLVKSVIWNIYQMIVLTILWADHKSNKSKTE